VEHLPKTKIDGACFWVDECPVIALSARYDRIDNFWWVLLHELGHVASRHAYSLDIDLEAPSSAPRSDEEVAADQFAREHILPQEQFDDFIARVCSIYSSERIEGFAKTIGVHPGVVVGQLHHREEVHYSSFRKMLVPVRDTLTSAALTDGWGHTTPHPSVPGLVC
ncbi:MAG: ImmA/IrrE family metallo-endopeptidase, partial [Chloroflexota bacterium]